MSLFVLFEGCSKKDNSLQEEEIAENKDEAVSENLITISTGEWVPWTGEKIYQNGFVCHIVKEIFKNAGYEVKFQFYPWERAYNLLANGDVDASAFWYQSEKRKKKCYYSDTIALENIVFFHLKSKPMNNWNKLEDLKKYTIGVSRGNTYVDRLWNLGKKNILKLDVANSDIQNFKKLLHGRIDIFPASYIMAYGIMRHNNISESSIDKITHNKKPLKVQTGHLIFPKVKEDSKVIMKKFNASLKKFREKGTYDLYLNHLKNGKYSK